MRLYGYFNFHGFFSVRINALVTFRFANLIIPACIIFVGLIPAITMPASAGEGRVLTLGRITQDPGNNIDRLNAMADYLKIALAPDGIEAVEIVIAETPDKMRALLRNGEVDLFSETPFIALELIDEGLAEPLMREWKKGTAEYHTVIIARRDGPIHSLADLSGRKVAFEDPGSTSGYLLPRSALEAAGLTLSKLDNPRSAPPDGKVGYSFANGEINVVAWVNRGLADAGAISNIDWESADKAPERLKANLTVIHETEPVTRSLMMVRLTLDTDMKMRLASVLGHMHETSDGKAALKQYFNVSRYDPTEGDAATGMESARKVWRLSKGWNE